MIHPSVSVVFVAPSAYPMGGVQTWLDYVSRGLDAMGVAVTVALVAGKHHDVERYRRAWPNLPRVVTVANATGSREGRVRALVKMLEATQPDVVVSVNIADTFDAVARMRARGAPMRLAMSLHGLESDYFDQIAREAAWLDAVIVTNRLTQRRVIERGMPAERVLYAPYGIEPEAYTSGTSSRDGPHLRFGMSPEFTVGYCGRLEEPQKRFADFVALIQRLRAEGHEFKVRVAGDGPSADAAKATLDACLRDRLTWLGAVSAAELRQTFYAHVDALVITSSWETGPIVAWEAMAAGVPIVSSDYEGRREEGALHHDVNCLIFRVGDVAGAAAAVARLGDADLIARLVSEGRRLVDNRYTVARSVDAWSSALRMVFQLPMRSVAGRMDGAANAPSGRLDRWLGVSAGETARRMLGRAFSHHEAGGEWPHVYT